MPSVLFKLGLITAVLTGWVVYDRWDDWTERAALTADAVSNTFESTAKSSLPTESNAKTITTVYKWQDAKGRWHFGDAPPPGVKAVAAESYSNDVNVIPRLTAEDMAVLTKKKKPAESNGGVFSNYVEGVNQAGNVQNTTQNHAAQMQRSLENSRN